MSRYRTAIKLELPLPLNFYITIMKSTGMFSAEYPTFALAYIGADIAPDEDMLGDIQAVSANFNPDPDEDMTELELVVFTQPKKEILDFSDSYFIKVPVPTKETNHIFHKIAELGRYVLLINTDTYTYKALIDDESGEVLEATVEYRLIN